MRPSFQLLQSYNFDYSENRQKTRQNLEKSRKKLVQISEFRSNPSNKLE